MLQNPLNITVARLTVRGLLGRRRGLLLAAVPALLLVLALLIRATIGEDENATVNVLSTLALGTLVPLLGLIAGTGAIGPEIDDGSIIYLLAKPQPRWKIVVTKLVVAIGCTTLFGALPVYLAGVIMFGTYEGVAVAFAVATLLAGVAYSALFLLLGVVTRHAVVVGLLYSLVWESLVGSFVPGAKTLSVQQWALSLAHRIASPGVVPATVHLPTAVVLLVVVTLAATVVAALRLSRLTLAAES